MQVLKIMTLFIAMMFSCSTRAIDSKPYGSDPESYLLSKDSILFVVKLSGSINYAEFNEYFDQHTHLSREEIKKKWKKATDNMEDEYLILKTVKGNLLEVGSVINTPRFYDFVENTVVGGKYILFMKKTKNGYESNACDYANLNQLTLEKLYDLAKLDLNSIIDFVLDKTLMVCMSNEVNLTRE